MPDNKSKIGGQDKKKIAGKEEYEINYMIKKTGKKREEVKKAVEKFGGDRKKVEEFLVKK